MSEYLVYRQDFAGLTLVGTVLARTGEEAIEKAKEQRLCAAPVVCRKEG